MKERLRKQQAMPEGEEKEAELHLLTATRNLCNAAWRTKYCRRLLRGEPHSSAMYEVHKEHRNVLNADLREQKRLGEPRERFLTPAAFTDEQAQAAATMGARTIP